MKKRMMSVLLTLCMLVSIISAVPIAASAATSGTCGDNLTWTLDNNGTLTISGTGKMTSSPLCRKYQFCCYKLRCNKYKRLGVCRLQ